MNQQYFEFETVLKNKFLELRPTFSLSGTEPFAQFITDPTFKKLFIIDRTITNPEIFEAGYLLWEECKRDVDKFLALFDVKLEENRLKIVEVEQEKDDSTG